MLKELSIRNLAIIDSLDLSFAPGFNVFTGETGAGKSIILDAVSLVVGAKSDSTMVREGTDRASIEAVFAINREDAVLSSFLQREDLIDDPESDELTITREIRAEGRSVARVNGHTVNVGILREIGQRLLDIHGQSDHLSLLDPASHAGLVDCFAGNRALLQQYREQLRRYRAVLNQLNALNKSEEEQLRQRDMLNYQIQELKSAALKEEEEEALTQERDRLANAEALSLSAQKAIEYLEGRGVEGAGILDLAGMLLRTVEGISRIDSEMNFLSEEIAAVVEELNDSVSVLRNYNDQLEFNPRKLEMVEERLHLIHTLKRKYGGSIAAVLAFERDAVEKLAQLDHASEVSDSLLLERDQLKEKLTALADQLSKTRKQAAGKIIGKMEKELNDLCMVSAKFDIKIEEGGSDAAFTENGRDQLEFLIAPNPGEGLKPLAKIASGGETSRLMLALKHTLAEADDIPTMIFDEIDQGIGGRVGSIVGEKLSALSKSHQILCITHLPQLAAYNDSHFRVTKRVEDGRTRTVVEQLDSEGNRQELAMMLGSDITENLQAADAMIYAAHHGKIF
jgi:DNA repair protein RecN (Recombination protein N)